MARIVVLCTVVAVLAATSLSAQNSADACTLLKPADAQALAANAKVGSGVASTNPIGASTCEYRWGTGSVNSGATFLQLSVVTVAKVYPGMSPSLVKESFLLAAKGNPNTEVIPGISDIALYESGQEIQVKTTALAKGAMIELKLDTTGARAKKDQVIALLKTIIARL